MRYQISDEEVQKTYFYAKKALDSRGLTQKLGIYLALGHKNQPHGYYKVGFLFALIRPVVIMCFVGGIVLLFLGKFLLGVGVMIIGIMLAQFFGEKMQRYKRYFFNSSVMDSTSQKVGSFKLMKIVADEMSKESSMEVIIEALQKEIEDTLTAAPRSEDH